MKTNRKKIVNIVLGILSCCGIILIVGVCLLMVGTFMIDYRRNPHNKKADDAISRAVYEAVGAKKVYYLGKKEGEEGEIQYSYYIHYGEEGLMEEVAGVVNRELEKESTGSRVEISFVQSAGAGNLREIARLCNYVQGDGVFVEYDTLQYLHIDIGANVFRDPYDMYNRYQNISNIRYLSLHAFNESENPYPEIEEKISRYHTCWPELETVEIYCYGARRHVTRYEHFLKEGKGLMEEISDAEAQLTEHEKKNYKSEIVFVQDRSDGAKTLFLLRNHKDNSEETAFKYDGFQYLWIFRTGEGDEGNPYFDLEAYKDIPGIRYLKIDEKIQNIADEAGIDWYEYWPELETVEVYSSEK